MKYRFERKAVNVKKKRRVLLYSNTYSLLTSAYSKLLPERIKTTVFSFKAKRAFNKAAKKAALERKAKLVSNEPQKANVIEQTVFYIQETISNARSKRAFNNAAKKAAKQRRAKVQLDKERDLPSKNEHKKTNTQKETTTAKKKPKKKKRKKFSLFRRFVSLLLKIMLFAVCLIIVFGYIFGLSRNQSLNMQPAFQDGDLIFFFRTSKHYKANDTILIIYEEKNMVERVVAVGGDKVDITDDGLVVNNGLVQEPYAWGATTQFENGVTFPLTVPEGKVFVLGDNREHAIDSRILGCISEEEISGSVIGSFRRRNF